MLNKAIIMGRLTRDPEIRQTQSGLSVCSFSVAVDRDIVNKSTNQRETDFINVTAWRSTADTSAAAKRRMMIPLMHLPRLPLMPLLRRTIMPRWALPTKTTCPSDRWTIHFFWTLWTGRTPVLVVSINAHICSTLHTSNAKIA